MGPWYQHGFSTGCPRVARFPAAPRTLPSAVRARAKKAPWTAVSSVPRVGTREVHPCADLPVFGLLKGPAAATARPGSPARTGHVRAGLPDMACAPDRPSSGRHCGTTGRTGHDAPAPADRPIQPS